MAEGLETPDGTKLDLAAAEQSFNEAMAAPEGDLPGPKRMTPEQKEASKAAPKRSRPTKAEKPRTAAAVSQKVDRDFTEDVSGITTGVWLATAAFSYTQPYAAIIKLNEGALIASLNQGAQNNATVRGYVERASNGSGGMWMLGLGVTAANMGMQAMQLMKSPDLRKQLGEQTQAELKHYLEQAGIKPLETGTENAADSSSNGS
jgi:hypothetical protein